MTTRADVEQFLKLRRIAFVGVSRSPKDFTRSVFREFRRRGYDVVPVNPKAAKVDGLTCYRSVADVAPAPQGAMILTDPRVTLEVVRDCTAAGVRHVWMHRGAGCGSVSQEAVDFCRTHDTFVVAGECPFMFLPQAGLVHGLHRLFRRIAGTLPA
jgi:predicted CoA-binding protein